MPVPTLTAEQIEDIYTTTFDVKLPEIIDGVYNSNPLLAVMNMEERILLDGGKRIEQGIIYGKLNGGSYGRGDSFNTAKAKTKTMLIFDWKLQYVNLSLEGMDDLQNAGAAAAFDYSELQTQEAEMTMKDNLGSELLGNGLNNDGKAINGLEEAIDDGTNFATYGGAARGSGDAVALAVRARYDATGGSWTIPVLQDEYGGVSIENEKPKLILTTRTLWNALHNRVQPAQRYPTGPGFDDLARIGFESLRYQRAAVVEDSHVQSGRAYLLNTRFIKLIVHSARPGKLRGWMPTGNKDERLNQLLWAGNLIVGGPRFQAQQRGLVA